jgi:hypothetical protein
VEEYIQTIYDSIRSTTGSSSNKMSFSIRADQCNHPELRDRARVALSRTDAKPSTRDCYIFSTRSPFHSIYPSHTSSIFLSTQHQLICLFVQPLLYTHIHHHVRATDHSLKEGAKSLCPRNIRANLANASLQAVEALENFNIESPMKQPLFTAASEEKENIITKEVAVPVKGIPMADDLPEPEVPKPSAAPGIKGDEMNEPILQENPNRFVLFPIKYHEVSFTRLTRARRVKLYQFMLTNHIDLEHVQEGRSLFLDRRGD